MAEDLESQGLLAHSYDSLFSIRKRLRKVNDLTIPTRRGLGTNQIGAFVVVFLVSVITYGFILVPVLALLGIPRDPRIMAAWVLIPAFLVAQRIAKPMPSGKSIPGSLTSWMRYHLDDPVHRRGLPIVGASRASSQRTLHYQRDWDMADTFALGEPGQQDWTDAVTEHRMRGETVDLESWMDAKARASAEREAAERSQRNVKAKQEVYSRRGRAAGVLFPDDENDEKDAA